jgi:hypothetical protein
MKPRPSSDPSLHRKDGNGPYSPENCEWATIKIQSRHKRSTKLTAEIVAEIRRRDYIPARDFARTYKVDIKTVERVRSKKAWR